ncbi:MAG TPA: dynamin family protein [Arenicellales bacterium]|nr:dynamin family protein [Arenicellales bacterium]
MNTVLATDDAFGQRLHDYGQWRKRLADAIQAYQEWRDSGIAGSGDDDDERTEELRLYELVDSLRTDKLNIALVGEFSRGKTELINAIFFSDYDRRLLPSTPGRTTMCPMEIMYDPGIEPCIRLLPIETRKSGLTITELKKSPINWTTIGFDLDSPDDIANALKEVISSKTVSRREAEELGMLSVVDDTEHSGDECEIPVWRHAVVNYPHPLLENGLVVLDTPGLNALGTEPELTYSMLPSAHAIVFVLAADTGVTRSDLEIWQNHVCTASGRQAEARIAALNKIDTLWDDLSGEEEMDGFIQRQAEETRRLLDIPPDMVFPVSAQKGLLAKIRKDESLITRSGLPMLERKLSEDIVSYKRRLIRDKVVQEIGALVESSRQLIGSRISELETELSEIRQLRGKSEDVINDIVEKLRKHKASYEKEVQTFQVTRRLLADQVRAMLADLSMSKFDRKVHRTRESMSGSWTTQGLREGMAEFFKQTAKDMERVQAHANRIHDLANRIYRQFHETHNLPRMHPAKFSVDAYVQQFNQLQEEGERFRNSPSMLMTEQHFVIKKFFITQVSRARVVFEECNRATRSWTKAVLTPIHTQIQEHRVMIDRRLENLSKLKGNHASLGERITSLEEELSELTEKFGMIDNIVRNLDAASEEEVPPEAA